MSILSLAKSTLAVPSIFQLFQKAVGAPACHRRFLKGFARPRAGDRVIDLGCGTGAILDHLPASISYVGVDISRDYVDAARARFPTRGVFLCSDVLTAELSQVAPFDLAISFGVLHHLDDVAARAMVCLARRIVRPGGHLVTLDPCYVHGQPRLARLLIGLDRGRHVRTPEQYRDLFSSSGQLETALLSDALRIPYSLIVARLRLT